MDTVSGGRLKERAVWMMTGNALPLTWGDEGRQESL